MISQKNLFKLRLINALLFILFVFIQYNNVFSIKILTANPMLPLSLLVAIGMFCSEFRSALTGLTVGIFLDTVANTPPGFNSLVFMCLGLCSVLIIKHLFNNNVFAAFALCILCAGIYFIARWLVCIAFQASFTENLTYLFRTAFPSCIYTAVLVIPLYFLEKHLYKKYHK